MSAKRGLSIEEKALLRITSESQREGQHWSNELHLLSFTKDLNASFSISGLKTHISHSEGRDCSGSASI